MPSKMVTDREKAAIAVEAAALTLAADAAQGCAQLFAPLLEEGENLPDFHFAQALHYRLLRWQRQKVVAADLAHTRAVLAENATLRARDAAAARLYNTIINVRQLLESQYGQGGAEKLLALDPGIQPSDFQRLQRFARDAIALMTAPDFVLPPAQIVGDALTIDHLVDKLMPPLRTLEASLEAVEPKKREAQRTRKAKSETLATLDESIMLSARWLEANFARAGEHYHAERVRRSTHRRKPKPPTDSELDAVEKGDGEEKTGAEGTEEAVASTAPTGEAATSQLAAAHPTAAPQPPALPQPIATLQLVPAPPPLALPPAPAPVPQPAPAPAASQPVASAPQPAAATRDAKPAEKAVAKKEESGRK